jgi:hypothetical protein
MIIAIDHIACVTRWAGKHSRCRAAVRLSIAVSWTGLQGSCPFPCFPSMGLSPRRLPFLLRVLVSPVPRSQRYYEGATTSHPRINSHLLVRSRRPRDPPVVRARFKRSRSSRGLFRARAFCWCRPAQSPAHRAWTRMGSLRSSGDPSCAFAPFQDPGRTDASSPYRPHRCCPRYPDGEGFGDG